MSFANKKERPDSKDAAKLRGEYQKKLQEFQDSGDAASKAKLKDDKRKLFDRMVQHVTYERRDALHETQKVLAKMGKYKTDEQLEAEREKINEKRQARIRQEETINI